MELFRSNLQGCITPTSSFSILSPSVYCRVTSTKPHTSTTPEYMPPMLMQDKHSIEIIILRLECLAFLPHPFPRQRLMLLLLHIRLRNERKANDEKHFARIAILQDVTKSVRTSSSVDAETRSTPDK